MTNYSRQYARFHPDDRAHRNGLTLFHRRLLAPHLPIDRNDPILDVGCGRGYMLEDLRAMGWTNLTGIEPDRELSRMARERGLEVHQVDDSLKWLDGSATQFALVLLMDVLEHLGRKEQPGLLRAIAGRLKPGGRLVVMTPNAASSIASFWFHNDYTHRWSFTEDSLTFLLEECEFRNVRCTGPEFFPHPRYLFWLPTRRSVAWWLRCLSRIRHRAALIGELGWSRGRSVIVTPNLLAVADKPG